MIEAKGSLVAGSTTRISSPRGANRILRIFLWLLVPLVMWWAFKDVPIKDLGDVLNRLSITGILILVFLNILIFLLLNGRWWLILSVQGYRRSFFTLIGYRLASFGVTYFTPGPQFGGEPLQVYLLKERENLPTEAAAASVTLDKLLELLANFSFLLVGVFVILFSGVLGTSAPESLILLPLCLLLLPISYLVALWSNRQPISRLSEKMTGWFPEFSRLKSIHQTARDIEHQVTQFCKQNPYALLAAALLSVITWTLMVFEFNAMLRFLGVNLSPFQVLTALTAARIAFLLPLPAGLGSLEAGQVMAMSLIGISPALGLSLSLLIRVRDVILGGIGLGLGGLLSR